MGPFQLQISEPIGLIRSAQLYPFEFRTPHAPLVAIAHDQRSSDLPSPLTALDMAAATTNVDFDYDYSDNEVEGGDDIAASTVEEYGRAVVRGREGGWRRRGGRWWAAARARTSRCPSFADGTGHALADIAAGHLTSLVWQANGGRVRKVVETEQDGRRLLT